MTDTQLPLPPAQPHQNHQLFSDYYLNAILPKRPEWQLLRERAAEAKQEIAALFRAYTPSNNEAQTEHGLIRPLLKALGHDFELQPALKTPDGTKRPDYVFYRDAASLNANKNQTLTDTLPKQGGYAVGDAKYWERPLDMALKGKSADPFSNKNPSFQIAFYMQHSGVTWGILTNGRRWRLYHRETAHKLDRFYEIDLPALLEAEDAESFLYFYAFFRRAAFDEQPLGGAELLRASVEFAQGVGDSLKIQVYDALLHLAQGFLDYSPNHLTADPPTLKAIYDNALIVLYRLLFILYAEDRNLLPAQERGMYRDTYSLFATKRTVAGDLKSGKGLLQDTDLLWPKLKTLFRIIDQGNPPLHVATFNGGLFDPARHPFLERYTVGDARLQRAIEKLARVNEQFVDYRDLSVRHLGTIYEGLLEYHLEEGLGSEGFTLTLRNDKGERKATGSYYTPDYIVNYIVEQTVLPLLEHAVEGKTDDATRIEAVLNINVLDPAMGSGHFLVEATEVIARFLVDLAIVPEESAAGEADLAYWKRRVVQSCIYGVDLNPLAVELAKLSLWLTTVAKDRPLSFLDHHLRPGNALVGARLEALQNALPSRSAGGASRRASQQRARLEEAGQISMLSVDAFRVSMSQAVGNMWLIEASEARNVAQVKEQEALYRRLHADLTGKYGNLADLVTATHFGIAIDPKLWQPLADYATGRVLTTLPELVEKLDKAQAIAEDYGFFHWELEFPEVFFDRFGRPLGDAAGFNAVVGNPPYIRQEQLARFKSYFATAYPNVYHGGADLFVYFFGQALSKLKRGGCTSYISSNSWLRANYATPLRAFLRTETTVETLVDLGDNRVFADAPDVYPAIHIVRRASPPADHSTKTAIFTRGEGLKEFAFRITDKLFPVSMQDQPDSGWQLEESVDRKIFAKLMAHGRPLGEVVNGRILFGIKTGLNEVFIIDTPTRNHFITEDPSCASLLYPIRRGEDLRPWYQEDEGRWLVGIPYQWTRQQFGSGLAEQEAWDMFAKSYPSLAAHLAPFADIARKRGDKGEYWWELRPCDYYDEFNTNKIFWPDIAKFPRFVWDDTVTRIGNTGYFVPNASLFLLGILASRTIWYAISRLSQPFGERAGVQRFRLFTQFMARLPIPDASDAERDAIGQLAQALTEQARARYDLHRKTRHRLFSDFGVPGKTLNQKLTAWYDLDFPALRAELQKVFRRDIPIKERDDWETWFAERCADHAAQTAEIVRLETELNAHVYALFDLTAAEIETIESLTKYRYGAV